MPPFKLISDYQPKGDQPKAIKALVEGILRGEQHQVLLGITGSGKSLAADEPIWIYEEADGLLRPSLVPIGPFIDRIVAEARSQAAELLETEIVDARALPRRYFALSLNPETKAVEIKPIVSFLRHWAPKTLYRVRTVCGREVTVTGDHNLWVLREGKFILIKTEEARSGDFLPLPLSLQMPSIDGEKDLKAINLLDHLQSSKLYISCQRWLHGLSNQEKQALQISLKASSPSGYNKVYWIERRGERIDAQTFARIVAIYDLASLDSITIGAKKRGLEVPLHFPITDDFLELLGYYIAEGHAAGRYFLISSSEEESQKRIDSCLKKLGLSWNMRRSGHDLQISSKLFAGILAALCGRDASTKHLPPFWPQLSLRQLAVLLSAYFAGDGCVEHNTVTCITASPRLVSELVYALSRFGLWARLAAKRKKATNSHHRGGTYWQLSLSGQEDLRIFAEQIGFALARKQDALKRLLDRSYNTNVDVIPHCSPPLSYLRKALGLPQEGLAQHVGMAQAMISFIEHGHRQPSRTMFGRILDTLAEIIQAKGQTSLRTALENLRSLSRVRWTRVAKVEKVLYDRPYVYDLSVEDNETFFGGFGGLFVHNTFTIANVVEQVQKPTLVICHNKTLAAQLYNEFKTFFPENAVEYFVSYYDYYQPEAYVPQTDTYIEKDAAINEHIDKLRHSATRSLLERRDCLIVASVSCIYGLGSPEAYYGMMVFLEEGGFCDRDGMLRKLVEIQYQRNDYDFHRGTFRVRGDVVEIFPAYSDTAIRVDLFGEEVEALWEVDPLTGEKLQRLHRVPIYPANHYVTPHDGLERAFQAIAEELEEQCASFEAQGKLLEAQRLRQRTLFDLEMMREIGTCKGIENYSRHLSGRRPGEPPPTLMDYFPKDALIIIDESHQTIPQLRGMYHGDRSRKETLVAYGFRLPSALDNRPLTFEEFERCVHQVIYVSATPGPYELEKAGGKVVEQIIRPTGLIDPQIEVKPTKGQIDDLVHQIKATAAKDQRVLVTTLTKRMAEELTDYLLDVGIRARYLHSDIGTLERNEIIRDLRLGKFDVLVGINLLREGLDLPEVSLVAILDADKEGFLRSTTSLIQTIGRTARNVEGKVILYADTMTNSMREAIEETNRRRRLQMAYNRKHGITPETIKKQIHDILSSIYERDYYTVPALPDEERDLYIPPEEVPAVIAQLEKEMRALAKRLEFERAAEIRDRIRALQERRMGVLKG